MGFKEEFKKQASISGSSPSDAIDIIETIINIRRSTDLLNEELSIGDTNTLERAVESLDLIAEKWDEDE